MGRFLDKDWKTWRDHVRDSVDMMLCGLIELGTGGGELTKELFVAVVMCCRSAARAVKEFYKREPKATFIIWVVFVVIILVFLAMHMSERTHRVNAEYERDSLAYELSRYTVVDEGRIVDGNDTITFKYFHDYE